MHAISVKHCWRGFGQHTTFRSRVSIRVVANLTQQLWARRLSQDNYHILPWRIVGAHGTTADSKAVRGQGAQPDQLI